MRARTPLLALATGAAAAGIAAAAASATSSAPFCYRVATPPAGARAVAKPKAALSASKTYDVTMSTNCGSFTIRLDQKQSPKAAASIVSLVQHHFYDKTVFHRIVWGWIIQGGDPLQTGSGGPGYETVDTPPATATYVHGVVAMAKSSSEPYGAAGGQFFVVCDANAGLPAQYAIVGKVIKGLAVVDKIGTFGDPKTEVPVATIEILKATLQVT